MNIKKTGIGLVMLLAIIAAPLLIKLSEGGKKNSVEIAQLENRIIRASILASGKLTHEEEVKLSSEVIGNVVEILVNEGDKIDKGQLLLKLDDYNFVATLKQQEAQVKISQIDIERQSSRVKNLEKQWLRQKSLFEKNLLSEEKFDDITYELAQTRIDLKSSSERLLQAQAQLLQARDQLRKTKIKSPISGIITSLDIKVGETAIASSTNIPGSSLMTIANPDSIYTEVLVDEADIANISVGQTAEVVAIAYPNKTIKGIVGSIASSAKQAPGRQGLSFIVKINITDANEVELRPGMSCRAEIHNGGEHKVATIPIQAILFHENLAEKSSEHYIFIEQDGIAKRTSVEVGASDDEFQEVTTKLSPNTNIIVGPNKLLRQLRDGDAVRSITDT